MQQRGANVYNRPQLLMLVRATAENIDIPLGTKDSKIIEILTTDGNLHEIEITSAATSKTGVPYKTIKRLAWGQPSVHQIATALRNGSYLSHATAAALHDLAKSTNASDVYVNKEQSEKQGHRDTLTQDGIDRAFKNKVRRSNYIYETGGARIILLNGKNTDRLGVTTLRWPHGTDLPCTDLERTLIDITVRPHYAGGVNTVLAAFVAARGRTNVKRLADLLRRIAHAYPYQQAVAFYCDRAGYDAHDLKGLEKKTPEFDFYLTNQMPKPRHDKRWRIYYPRTLD